MLAVAVEVTLVIIVVGLTSGLLLESAKRTEGVGADIMVQPPSASVFMAFGGAPMPIAIADKLRQLEYVQAVAPVLVQFNSVNGLDIVYGIDPETFRAVSGGFVFHSGHDLQEPNDILIDDVYSRS
ncbi:MAG TPA: ABC transporter permease, partial [Chthoniobacterales bacterium]